MTRPMSAKKIFTLVGNKSTLPLGSSTANVLKYLMLFPLNTSDLIWLIDVAVTISHDM